MDCCVSPIWSTIECLLCEGSIRDEFMIGEFGLCSMDPDKKYTWGMQIMAMGVS